MADSFMTSPREPVRTRLSLPGITMASMKRMSPPVGVQAMPVATPTASSFRSWSLKIIGRLRYFSSPPARIVYRFLLPEAISLATFRQTAPISLSRFRTPASRVYSMMILCKAASVKVMSFFFSPFSVICLGIR
ncbi:MAG: hypothetical protein BWY86_00276 [Candidatus Aminicenantes bacterium ADurb.Bin508]|nr:MAG: hypothetical protein BWY86_00276 [Candidatus Aminicenantes bacterium ADurb.Bin508]